MFRRSSGAILAAALVLVALTACSYDAGAEEETSEKSVASDGPQILRLSDAEAMLLTGEDVGEGFKPRPEIPDLESDTNGCLGIFDQAQTNQQFEVETQFVRGGVTVTSQVTSYSTVSEPKGDIRRFRKAVRSCRTFQETRDAIVYDVELIFNETVTNEAAQDQLSVTATGSIIDDGKAIPLTYRYTLTRIENNVIGIQIASTGPNPDKLSQLVRLNDVLVGRLLETAGPPEEAEESDGSGPREGPAETSDGDSTDAVSPLAVR